MATPPTPAPAATVSAFAAQISEVFQNFYNQQNQTAIAAFTAAGDVGTPPLLTFFDADVEAQIEALANQGAQIPADLANSLLYQIPYVASPPPVLSLFTIGAEIGHGIFNVTTTAASWPVSGSKETINGKNYLIVAVTPFRWVAQLVP